MISLRENEKVIETLHRHWIVLFGPTLVLFLLSLAPILVFYMKSLLFQYLDFALFLKLFIFCSSIYYLILIALFLYQLTSYWLDMWVITNRRIIAVDQVSLFHRQITEFELSRIQDITTKIPNLLATVLNFGNISIHTAGLERFTLPQIPRHEEIKSLIVRLASK